MGPWICWRHHWIGDFDEARKSAVEVELFGHKVKVLALEPLIKAKESVGRPKDLLAATELRAIAVRRSEDGEEENGPR